MQAQSIKKWTFVGTDVWHHNRKGRSCLRGVNERLQLLSDPLGHLKHFAGIIVAANQSRSGLVPFRRHDDDFGTGGFQSLKHCLLSWVEVQHADDDDLLRDVDLT
ncbi:hypothetical protein D3C77_659850 [compost metagenome]